MTTKKQSETATILRAGRSKGATHNSAARKATGKEAAAPEKKRERIMINCPVELVEPIKAAAEAKMISMSMYFVFAAKEAALRDGYLTE